MAIKRNLHNIDRLARLVIGIGCLYVAVIKPELLNDMLVNSMVGIFGAVNLWAAAVSNCPVYHVAGLSTYKDKEQTE